MKAQLGQVKNFNATSSFNLLWNTEILSKRAWIWRRLFNKDFSEIKNGAYIINLDECESIVAHWIALYINAKNVTYFDSFEVEHVSEVIRKSNGNKNIITNIYRVQAFDSIMCEYFCIGFADFILKGKCLLEYTNVFPPNEYKTNDKIILKYHQ